LETTLVGAGCRSVTYSPDGQYLAAGLTNGEVLLFAVGNDANPDQLHLLNRVRDRKGPIHDLKFSPNGQLLAVASDEDSVDFYSNLPDARQALKRVGKTSSVGDGFVVHIDWLIDDDDEASFIQVDTSDHRWLCFDAPGGNGVPNNPSLGWAGWSSILGDAVRGMWPADAARADVNCCTVSNGGTALVSGDDFGAIKLFGFPCPITQSGIKKIGHAAHVTNVQFTSQDKYVVSTGGEDSCVFVWRCET
jgi:echinoderm microtubule-associated protein-like 5